MSLEHSRGRVTDCPDVSIGHHSMGDTGVTVLTFAPEAAATASGEVRGGGPGARETDLLAAENTVSSVHAIVLAGGSAYGLAAADGVMNELEARGRGFPVFGENDDGPVGPIVPIVPAAVIFDLVVGDADHRPSAADGRRALQEAMTSHTVESGSVGAGCGATAGKLRGGFGQASVQAAGYTVAAAVVANPVGDVIDPATGHLYGDLSAPVVDVQQYDDLPVPGALNTTIGAIVTDAPLSKAQLRRLAMCGHNGIAWAVRPSHTPLDGDTLFAISTAHQPSTPVDTETLTALCAAGSRAVCSAIVDAVVCAKPGYGLATYTQLANSPQSSQNDPKG